MSGYTAAETRRVLGGVGLDDASSGRAKIRYAAAELESTSDYNAAPQAGYDRSRRPKNRVLWGGGARVPTFSDSATCF